MYNTHVCFVVGGNAFDCASEYFVNIVLEVLSLFKMVFSYILSVCGEIFIGKHKQTTGDLQTGLALLPINLKRKD